MLTFTQLFYRKNYISVLPPLPSSSLSSSLVELPLLPPSGDNAVQLDHSDVFHSGCIWHGREFDIIMSNKLNSSCHDRIKVIDWSLTYISSYDVFYFTIPCMVFLHRLPPLVAYLVDLHKDSHLQFLRFLHFCKEFSLFF